MTILDTYKVGNTVNIVFGIMFAIFSIFLLVLSICLMIEKQPVSLLIFGMFAIVSVVAIASINEGINPRTRIKCTIDDSYPAKELLQTYTIVKQEGLIYTLEQKIK